MVISGAANALFILKGAARGSCQERSLPLRTTRGGVRRGRRLTARPYAAPAQRAMVPQ